MGQELSSNLIVLPMDKQFLKFSYYIDVCVYVCVYLGCGVCACCRVCVCIFEFWCMCVHVVGCVCVRAHACAYIYLEVRVGT